MSLSSVTSRHTAASLYRALLAAEPLEICLILSAAPGSDQPDTLWLQDEGWGCWEQENLLSSCQSHRNHSGLETRLGCELLATEQLHRVQPQKQSNDKFVCTENTGIWKIINYIINSNNKLSNYYRSHEKAMGLPLVSGLISVKVMVLFELVI